MPADLWEYKSLLFKPLVWYFATAAAVNPKTCSYLPPTMPTLTQFSAASLKNTSYETILSYKGYNSISGNHGAVQPPNFGKKFKTWGNVRSICSYYHHCPPKAATGLPSVSLGILYNTTKPLAVTWLFGLAYSRLSVSVGSYTTHPYITGCFTSFLSGLRNTCGLDIQCFVHTQMLRNIWLFSPKFKVTVPS